MGGRWMRMMPVVLVVALLAGVAVVLGLFDTTELSRSVGEPGAGHRTAPPPNEEASSAETQHESQSSAPPREDSPEHADETERPVHGQEPAVRDGTGVEDEEGEPSPEERPVILYGGLRGRVVDGEREPVYGVRVEVEMHDIVVDEDADGEPQLATKRDFTLTDANGGFRFEGLQAQPGPSYIIRLAPETEGALPAIRHVPNLPDDEVLDVGTLRLRVEAVLHGRVLDPSGSPVPGARVVLERGTRGRLVRRTPRPPGYMLRALGFSDDSLPVRFETAGEDGTFRFDQLEPLPYELRAQASGLRDSVVHRVSLDEGEESEPLVLRVRAALSLQVDVRDVLGAPVEGAEVTARLIGPRHRERGAITQTTDRFGHAAFDELADVLVVLSLQCRGFLPTEVTATLNPGEERTRVQVTLARTSRLRGRLVEPDGEPLAGEAVWLRLHRVEGLDEAQTETDEKGRFEFAELEPAPVTLEARQTRFGPFFLEAGTSLQVDTLVVPHTGTLAVEVRDPAGQPVARAGVEVQPLDASRKTFLRTHSAAEAVTGTEGRAELAVSAGTVVVRVVADGFAAHALPEPLVVEAGETHSLRVSLSGGGRVVGKVRDERNRPLSLPVQLIRKGGPQADWVRKARSDAQGAFEFAHVPPGLYRVRAASETRVTPRPFKWFKVRRGEVTECEVTARTQSATLWLSLRNLRETAMVTIAALHGFEGVASEGHTVLTRQRVRSSGRIRNLPVGRMLVAFVSVDSNAAPLEFTVGRLSAGRNHVTVEVPSSSRQRAATSTLHGRLTYHGEPRPVAGASLRLQGTFAGAVQPVRHATSDRNGRFRFERLQPGDYRVTVAAPGLATSVHEVKIGREDEVELEVQVDAAGYLLFAVGVEAPAPEVRVRATAEVEGRAATFTQTAKLGELLIFSNLHRNEIYEIHISADHHATYRGTYLVRAGDTAIVHITLKGE